MYSKPKTSSSVTYNTYGIGLQDEEREEEDKYSDDEGKYEKVNNEDEDSISDNVDAGNEIFKLMNPEYVNKLKSDIAERKKLIVSMSAELSSLRKKSKYQDLSKEEEAKSEKLERNIDQTAKLNEYELDKLEKCKLVMDRIKKNAPSVTLSEGLKKMKQDIVEIPLDHYIRHSNIEPPIDKLKNVPEGLLNDENHYNPTVLFTDRSVRDSEMKHYQQLHDNDVFKTFQKKFSIARTNNHNQPIECSILNWTQMIERNMKGEVVTLTWSTYYKFQRGNFSNPTSQYGTKKRKAELTTKGEPSDKSLVVSLTCSLGDERYLFVCLSGIFPEPRLLTDIFEVNKSYPMARITESALSEYASEMKDNIKKILNTKALWFHHFYFHCSCDL
jgi:hypothetical protein